MMLPTWADAKFAQYGIPVMVLQQAINKDTEFESPI
jgi:hypothetical protein